MASEIKVDTISEKTSANGVTIDSLSIKDGGLVAAGNIDINGNNLVHCHQRQVRHLLLLRPRW